jgi:transcriptional regulator with XRE-family HTH domain
MANAGKKIAELREKRGLTQDELAARLGITRAALSHYETGRRQPDYDTLCLIAEFFHVSVDYLLDREQRDLMHFVESLELSDEAILEQFDLTIDGQKLTAEEAQSFIAFVRAQRSIRAKRERR